MVVSNVVRLAPRRKAVIETGEVNVEQSVFADVSVGDEHTVRTSALRIVVAEGMKHLCAFGKSHLRPWGA